MALTIAFKAHLLAASLRAAIAIQQITVITFFCPTERGPSLSMPCVISHQCYQHVNVQHTPV